jgi:hypothetical protein
LIFVRRQGAGEDFHFTDDTDQGFGRAKGVSGLRREAAVLKASCHYC